MRQPAPPPPASPRDSMRVVRLHPLAPRKPPAGGACNGCGVCCAWAPCPLGIVLSRRRRGACAALLWDGDGRRYRCGALAAPGRWLPWLPAHWARRMASRWISAASGCDAALEVG